MDLLINSIIRYRSQTMDDPDPLYRVIFIEGKYYWLFQLQEKKKEEEEKDPNKEKEKTQKRANLNPERRKIKTVSEDLATGKAIIELEDPRAKKQLIKENGITPKEREIRDFAYRVVLALTKDNNGQFNPDILVHSKRIEIITRVAKEFAISSKTALRYLRQFWDGGMTQDAMLPSLVNCGARKQVRNHKGVKLGNPNAIEKAMGKSEPRFSSVELRLIMAETLRTEFKPGMEYTDILKIILDTYFSLPNETQTTSISTKSELAVSGNQLLTYRQLYHFIETVWQKNPKLLQRLKHGERRFNQNYRALTGNASAEARAPGAVVQLDPTPLDIDIAFTLQRYFLVGSPTVYLLMDVYSKCIVGFSISVKPASWRTALPALVNAFDDKVEFCARYGITITADEWPCMGLPKKIITDNAEFASQASNFLPAKLNIDVDNEPSYRCDLKGLVERRLGLTNKVVRKLPGGKAPIRNRGDANTTDRVCLTLYELTQILILTILYYNNFHYLKNYVLDADQIADQVPPIPNALWTWGVANRGGELRAEDREKVMFSLLPEDHVSMTANGGFKFKGKTFHCNDKVLEDNLSIKARKEGVSRFPIVYDPWHPDTIYCQFNQRESFVALQVSDEHKDFRGLHEAEWDAFDEDQKERELAAVQAETRAGIIYRNSVNTICKTAEAETKADIEAMDEPSKSGRTKRKGEARQAEHDLQEGNLSPAPSQTPVTPDQTFTSISGMDQSQYVKPPSHANLIRNLEKETSDEEE